MKFSHLADIHIGSYRDQKLGNLILENFGKAIDTSISENVDFVLIAGDLFNTSMPSIEHLKQVVITLKKCKDNNIPVYIIAGSHDYSVSGKTIIDVLEHADLVKNVLKGEVDENNKINLKFTIDKKTGAKITGILGKKRSLEKEYFENLNKEYLENEPGFKIFMFHTTITELKPKEMEKLESEPLSFLPKNFDYYAGGHVHIVENKSFEGYKNIVYPGPIFPTNELELEKLKHGSFFIYDNGKIIKKNLDTISAFSILLDCNNMSKEQIEEKILYEIKDKDFTNKIVTLRLFGKINSRVSEIDFKKINSSIFEKNAFFVMRNISKLVSKDYEDVKIRTTTQEQAENEIIEQSYKQFQFQKSQLINSKDFLSNLMNILSLEKQEGMTKQAYENMLLEKVKNFMSLK